MAASILCPLCRTNTVPAPSWSFKDTSVTVDTCGNHAADSVSVKVTVIQDLTIPETVSFHRNGLVAFA